MVYSFFATKPGIGPLLIRMGLAICIFPHGAQKAVGWFEGSGFEVAMDYFTNTLGFPYFMGVLAIVFEFTGSICISVGFLTRLWALGIGITLSVAGLTHMDHGFFMNWFGDKGGEGFEYHILAASMAFSLVISGGGSYSIDRPIAHQLL
ncbi:DoxX family protein [Leptospira inadai serovar Lyme str. 10]|uniref:DoxX family protein n=2 Tax=Leptospira inadai serovar Lyme TaxID=293084 RepID=V6HRA4_9LEPT|nr:DoxX family protein [Leptospira inadai]EQA35029.1 DoxX family protein [Leptospira inadai serovar Lyme str. 10]PNV75893.1 DoxX family protein [Leptospira inadai serovar Lyme]